MQNADIITAPFFLTHPEEFRCPGYYKCHGQTNCLSDTQICDGVSDCPGGDDELFCGISCPVGCLCVGLFFSCQQVSWNGKIASQVYENVRELHLVRLSTDSEDEPMTIAHHLSVDVGSFQFLIVLNLSSNAITTIETKTFNSNYNLRVLCLAQNAISYLGNTSFINLVRLKFLDLSGNPLKGIHNDAFLNLESLEYLSIEETLMEQGTYDTFLDLASLRILHSDKYLFCCLVRDLKGITECLPEPDQFSSCEDLIRVPVLRVFIWILGISALLGNAYVVFRRLRPTTSSRRDITRVQDIMVGHLAVADSLMGVYMLVIASADVFYRDRYAFYAEQWQTSFVCKFAGFLSVLSSETSVFFMTVISVDRCFGMLFPFSDFKLRPKSAKVAALLVWIITAVISLLPVLIKSYFGNAFYGRSTVCLALPLTSERPAGWEYSVALFIGVNLAAFITMLFCYSTIYCIATSSSVQVGRQTESRMREIQLALRMAFLVFSDMCCWMPIIIIGILSLSNTVTIPGITYAWTAVFILPLNSSLNPYLYTLLSREIKKRKSGTRAGNSAMSKRDDEYSFSNDVHKNNAGYSPDGDEYLSKDERFKARVLKLGNEMAKHNILVTNPVNYVSEFTTLSKLLSERQLLQNEINSIRRDLETAMEFLHQEQIVCGTLSDDLVIVQKDTERQLRAYLIFPSLTGLSDLSSSNIQSTRLNQLQTDHDKIQLLLKHLGGENNLSMNTRNV